MTIILLLGIPLLVLAVLLLSGNGTWMIAGYRNAAPEERAKFNAKAMCRLAGSYLLMVDVAVFGLLLQERLPWIQWACMALVLAATVAVVGYAKKNGLTRRR